MRQLKEIKTALGRAIKIEFIPYELYRSGWGQTDITEHDAYWIIWIQANEDFTAGQYYKLDGRGEVSHWHLYEDGTERRLDEE